jgi:hypothetical protein
VTPARQAEARRRYLAAVQAGGKRPIDPVVVAVWLVLILVGLAFVFATGWAFGWLGTELVRMLSGEFGWPGAWFGW